MEYDMEVEKGKNDNRKEKLEKEEEGGNWREEVERAGKE